SFLYNIFKDFAYLLYVKLNKRGSIIAEQSTADKRTYQIKKVEPVLVLGFQDEHLDKIDDLYPNTKLTARGSSIKMTGQEERIQELMDVFSELDALANENGDLTRQDV